MIHIYSRDERLVALIAGLFGKGRSPQRVHDLARLDLEHLAAGDLLLIDLKGRREESLPVLAPPALVLVEVPDFDQAIRLLRQGIRGYGNRYMRRENLAQAVRAVKGGQVWLPPAFVNQMVAALPRAGPGGALRALDRLSRREAQVAGGVARGLSNKELAERMNISVRTVKAHLTSIFGKLGVRGRLELAVKMKEG